VKKRAGRKCKKFVVGLDEQSGKVVPSDLRIHALQKSAYFALLVNDLSV